MNPFHLLQSSTRQVVCLLLGLAILLLACYDPGQSRGPAALQQLLEQDSLYRAINEDSSAGHINFDYENLNRASWQKPELVIEALGDLSNKSVVEVGAGTGFFTRMLVQRAQKVIALDIDPNMLLLLDSLNASELDREHYNRIDARLVPADAPNLKPAEANAAVLVNVFMYIQDRPAYLRALTRGLSPGSPVLIVDFKKQSTPLGPPVNARLTAEQVAEDMQLAGLQNLSIDESSLVYQYMVKGQAP